MSEHDPTQAADDPLDAIVCEFIEAMERGESPDPEEFIARHPEHSSELRRFLSDYGQAPAVADPGQTCPSPGVGGRDTDSGEPSRTAPPQFTDFVATTKIGSGGMGDVFEAHQHSLRRTVAVKVMKPSKPGGRRHERALAESLSVRFLREAEITGRLQHPGIVPVYAAGRAEDGQPYYAMRLIEGADLDAALREFHADITDHEDFTVTRAVEFRRLLRSFISVCHAVDYAHHQQVLHRDLKPQNVMLGSFGETLVVDWGLAKAMSSPTLTSATTTVISAEDSQTQVGSAVGTPAFMSPEQAAGDADRVGPASDLYSLGATLYCLLTGRPAFKGTSAHEVFDRVKRGEFPPPRSIRRRIPRPLEAICLKAMAKAPEERYSSARELADDLENWLADERVTAWQEPFLARCGRWARRHRTGLRAGAIALTAVALVSAVSAVLLLRAYRVAELRREQSVARLRQARQTTDRWVSGMSEALKAYPGIQEERLRFLELAADDYRQFAEQASDDPSIELERVRALLQLGGLERTLDQLADAEKTHREALELADQLAVTADASDDARLEALNCRIGLALVLFDQNRSDEAIELYRAALAGAAPSLDSSRRAREIWGTAALDLAVLLASRQRAEAGALLDDALTRAAAWRTEAPADAFYSELAAKLHIARAELSEAAGQGTDALAALQEAQAIINDLVGRFPQNNAYRNDFASTFIRVAIAARTQLQLDLEQRSLEDAIDMFSKLAVSQSDVPVYSQNLALTQADLAQALVLLGEAQQASDLADQAAKTFQSLAQAADLAPYKLGWAAALDVRGQALAELNRDEEARAAFDEAEKLLVPLAELDPLMLQCQERLAVVRNHLAIWHLSAGSEAEVKRGEELAQQSSADFEQLCQAPDVLPATRFLAARAHVELGTALIDAGLQDAGQQRFDEAQRQFDALLKAGGSPEQVHEYAAFLVDCAEHETERIAAIEPALDELVQRGAAAPAVRTTLGALWTLTPDGPAQAAAILENAMASETNDRTQLWLARAYAKLGRRQEAEQRLAAGRAWLGEHRPGNLRLPRLADRAQAEMPPLETPEAATGDAAPPAE